MRIERRATTAAATTTSTFVDPFRLFDAMHTMTHSPRMDKQPGCDYRRVVCACKDVKTELVPQVCQESKGQGRRVRIVKRKIGGEAITERRNGKAAQIDARHGQLAHELIADAGPVIAADREHGN